MPWRLRAVWQLLKPQCAFLRDLIGVPRPDDDAAAAGVSHVVVMMVEPLQQRALRHQLHDSGVLVGVVSDPFNANTHLEVEVGHFRSSHTGLGKQLQLGATNRQADIATEGTIANAWRREQQ
jgi:hypothetical protein